MWSKYKVPRRLKELGTSARAEFERLLIASSPAVLLHLNYQHRATCDELLADCGLSWSDVEGVVCETQVVENIVTGTRSAYCDWRAPRRLLARDAPDRPPDDHWRAVVMLCALVRYLGSDQGRGALKRAPAEGAERMHREVLRAWWFALVVPELHSRGVSIFQSENRKRTNYDDGFTHSGEDVRDFARKLRRDESSLERSEALERLQARFNFGRTRANQILREIGWPGRRGGPRTAKK